VQPEGLFLPQWRDHHCSQRHWCQRTPSQIHPGSVWCQSLRECHCGWHHPHSKDPKLCSLWVWLWGVFSHPCPRSSISKD
jgi:hypothetical protein